MALKLALRLLHAIFDGICGLFTGANGKKKEKEKEAVVTGGQVRPQSNRPITKPMRARASDVRLQAGDVSVVNNVYSNSYKIWFVDKSGALTVVGQVIFVSDRLALMPDHFNSLVFDKKRAEGLVEDDTLLHFVNAMQAQHSFELTMRDFQCFRQQQFKDRDISFVEFQGVRAHRNISQSFLTEKDLNYIGGVPGRLDICEIDDKVKLVSEHTRRIFVTPSLSKGHGLLFGDRKLERYVSCRAYTACGDCGAPLSLVDNTSYSGRTVVGIHVAGDEMRGVAYSAVVTREMVADAMAHFSIVQDCFTRDLAARGVVAQASYELPITHGGSFLPLFTVDKPISLTPKTSYFVTEMFGRFGPYDYLPAALGPVYRDGVLVYPMEKAVKPYSTGLFLKSVPELDQAVHIAMSRLTALTQDSSRRIYTFEEAVLGIPQERFRSIPRGTSAGFPYIYDVRDGKKDFFGDAEQYDLTTSLVE